MLHAGLDLSRARLDVCLIDDAGEVVGRTAAPPDADGLRHLVDGGSTGTVITGSAVLAGFAAAAFALTTLAARRARRMSPPVLHPELVL